MIFIEIYQDQTYFQRALDGNTFKITKLLFEKPTSYQSGQYEPLECHRKITFTIKTDTNDEENIHLDLGYMDYSTYRKTLNTQNSEKIDTKSLDWYVNFHQKFLNIRNFENI